jgi:hypothetical protein
MGCRTHWHPGIFIDSIINASIGTYTSLTDRDTYAECGFVTKSLENETIVTNLAQAKRDAILRLGRVELYLVS